jgi:Zn finger protein HypA/HybF involved in hydrogenase expression
MDDDAASTAQTTQTLVCIECGDESLPGSRGWRAYVLEAELLVYCPGCASREFDVD